MLLTQLRSHLRLNRRVSLSDLMVRFDMNADVLRDMLNRFIQKGQVKSLQQSKTACRTQCGGCNMQSIESYEWIA